MSFSKDIKKEIVELKLIKKHELFSFFISYILLNGDIINLKNNKIKIKIITKDLERRKKIESSFPKFFTKKGLVEIKQYNNFAKKSIFEISIIIDKIIFLKYLNENNAYLAENNKIFFKEDEFFYFFDNEDTSKIFLRVIFLENGYISDPEKNYHIEIINNNCMYIEAMDYIFKRIGIKSFSKKNKNEITTYIKDSDSIFNFLNYIGAHENMFKFEDIRIKKQLRNNINRTVNLETSNLSKMAKTYMRQKKAIDYIIEKKGIDYLSEDLQKIAKARIEHLDLSLSELSKVLNMSKSSVNYKLKKIENIKDNITKEINKKK